MFSRKFYFVDSRPYCRRLLLFISLSYNTKDLNVLPLISQLQHFFSTALPLLLLSSLPECPFKSFQITNNLLVAVQTILSYLPSAPLSISILLFVLCIFYSFLWLASRFYFVGWAVLLRPGCRFLLYFILSLSHACCLLCRKHCILTGEVDSHCSAILQRCLRFFHLD